MKKDDLINIFTTGIKSGTIPVSSAANFLAGFRIDDSGANNGAMSVQDIMSGREFSLTVNYNKTPDQMIKDNKYYKVEKRIIRNCFSSHETLTGIIDLRAKLFNFGVSVHNYAVREAIGKTDYRVGKMVELLAFDRFCPEMRGAVVAIGSSWVKFLNPYIPYSLNNGQSRELVANDNPKWPWSANVYFLAILKNER